ncbi:Zinc finger protein KNUCKLES [Striga hermonthica]|uniref:Zinc finger protein KNUCKLES n=1 Tax=Striga hermonthica TaxID=68872 RepID=A0A9N7RQR7_STRHE|nr:Zinc finger protein KNUCKLES [Striga hermonthica]
MANSSTYDFFKLNAQCLKLDLSSNSSPSVDPRLFCTLQALGGHQNTHEQERVATRRSLTAAVGFPRHPSATTFEIDGVHKIGRLTKKMKGRCCCFTKKKKEKGLGFFLLLLTQNNERNEKEMRLFL